MIQYAWVSLIMITNHDHWTGFPSGTWAWTRLTKLLHNPLFRMGQKLGRLLNQQVTSL